MNKKKKVPTKGKWMAKAFEKHPGKLHQQLHVPEGETIPQSELEKATHSSDAGLKREAVLALTARRYAGRHKKTA
jgi:hypothetical protein